MKPVEIYKVHNFEIVLFSLVDTNYLDYNSQNTSQLVSKPMNRDQSAIM